MLQVRTTTGVTVTLSATDNNLLNASGVAIPVGTTIPETSSGIYELPFYTMPNQAATITVSNGVDTENFTTTSCSPCPDPIPTLSQWGVLVFGLLILNLSLIFIKSKAHTLD